MANQIRIKRRASAGAAGAPTSLKNAELAYNEADNVLYYGYGDDGSGNATSIIGIAGSGSNVTIAGDQTISGNKTFSGDVDLTGAFKIDGTEVTATAAELNFSVGVTSNIQDQFDAITTDVSDLQTGTGLADGTTNYGTATTAGFSGSTVSDNATIKQALIDLETAVEGGAADTADLRTLTGTADGDTAYGTAVAEGFAVIGDNATIKAALLALDGGQSANNSDITDIRSAIGIGDNETDLGTFGGSGTTLTDNITVKAALEELEAALEDGSGALAGDSGTADFASGSVTVAGGTGVTTTGDNVNTLTIDLDSVLTDNAGTAGSYGLAGSVAQFTVNAQGQLTAAADVTIDITHSQVSDFDTGVQENTLDSLALPVADVAMNNQKITGLADPVADQDAVNKRYADALVNGLDVKQSVRVATTANITLSGTQTIDGISLVAGDRVLVKDQTTGADNGIYQVASGAWSRTADADNTPAGEVTSGMFTFVEEGSTNGDAGFVLQTTGTITLGATSLSFVQFSGAGQVIAGAGLSKSGNTLDINTVDTGRIVVNANDIDLATHGTAGTYIGFEVDAYGRVTSFTSETTLAGYGITDAQPLDATLTALAGLTTAADQLIYSTGSDTFSMSSLSTYGRSLIDDADAAAARTTLGLGTIATQDANNVAITGGTIDNIEIDGGTF